MRDGVARGLACCSAMSASKPSPRGVMETIGRGVAYGRAANDCPLVRSRGTQAFGPGLPSQSSSAIGRGVREYVHGQTTVSPELGRMRNE